MKRLSLLAVWILFLFGMIFPVLAEESDPSDTLSPESLKELPSEEPQKPARPNQILDIEIRGNQIVSTNTILSKISSQKDTPLVQETVNEDLKRLYATGYFQDIKMEVEERPEGYVLVVQVIEKPVIRQIVLEGFSVFKEDKLRKQMKVVEGQILDNRAVKEGVEAIKKLYADKGFRFVDVQSELKVDHATKEATVYIRVIEGERFKIKSVAFEGNQAFRQKKLIKLMKTRKKGWFFRSGVFKESTFQKDVEQIQLFYQQEGYLDVKVVPSFQYDKKGRWIFIKVLVDEGKHYLTGDIKIQGNVLFPESEIWQVLEMLPGLTYSQYYLSKDIDKIRTYYHEQGHMDARVVPDVQLNRDTGKVDLRYQIEEGDLYFVEKVIVRGNTKTKDLVIRRELRIRPGERFDGEKITKSKQRLDNLGYFEEVTYDTEPSATAPNRKDLIFRVKEKRTGELSFGGGISSVDRFIAFAEIAQKNFDLTNWPRFTGGGQSLSLRARVGSISQDYSLSFVEPYIFNKPITFGLDIFDTRRDDENVDFEEERRGASVTFSKLFRDVYRVGTGYTLESVKVDEISDDAPASVRRVAGSNLLSRWKLFNTYDTRDNVFNPTKGTLASLSAELVGSFLGGDEDFYVLQTSATQYRQFFKSHILEGRIKLGTAQDFGSSPDVPVFDRFFAGGLGTVRGFGYRRVGPIEKGDAVGGQTLALVNLEYTVPVPRLEAFRAAAFIDAGHVNSRSYRVGFGDFSISTGPGLKIKTPIGPVAFYYGYPIANRDTENRNGRFEFSLSRGF